MIPTDIAIISAAAESEKSKADHGSEVPNRPVCLSMYAWPPINRAISSALSQRTLCNSIAVRMTIPNTSAIEVYSPSIIDEIRIATER